MKSVSTKFHKLARTQSNRRRPKKNGLIKRFKLPKLKPMPISFILFGKEIPLVHEIKDLPKLERNLPDPEVYERAPKRPGTGEVIWKTGVPMEYIKELEQELLSKKIQSS